MVFELAKKMQQSDKNTDFLTQLGKWISAVPEPEFQNETLQKYRETIPLVQLCLRFELLFYRFEVLSKI